MFNIVIIAIVVLVWLAVVGGYLRFDREQLLQIVTRLSGGALLVVALFLAVTGREMVAAATALVGLTIMGAATNAVTNFGFVLGRRMRQLLGFVGLTQFVKTGRSTVRAAALEVEVDEATGILSGWVLAGRFEGQQLARLSVAELAQFYREIRSDQDSRALLEAYLNRRLPRWREDAQFDAYPRHAGAASSSAMTHEEAHQVLGLKPGAGETEIREAHRRLIKAVHPDVGGSAFLASKINEAKDRLIGKHNTRSTH
ncbi:MAG: molecular chaperone DnaJ [Ancalomicrobiaceae bacterium]|nr:molecular chaperone DnaJ [Ancalomicrobiaceae bacterium]